MRGSPGDPERRRSDFHKMNALYKYPESRVRFGEQRRFENTEICGGFPLYLACYLTFDGIDSEAFRISSTGKVERVSVLYSDHCHFSWSMCHPLDAMDVLVCNEGFRMPHIPRWRGLPPHLRPHFSPHSICSTHQPPWHNGRGRPHGRGPQAWYTSPSSVGWLRSAEERDGGSAEATPQRVPSCSSCDDHWPNKRPYWTG